MYNQETADKVCELLAQGKSLRQTCRELELNECTVRKWARTNPEFGTQYACARTEGYEAMADELVDIADGVAYPWAESDVARDRLSVDTRKWMLSKMLPKVYGEKLDVTSKDQQIGFTVADAVAIAQAKAKQRTEDSAK